MLLSIIVKLYRRRNLLQQTAGIALGLKAGKSWIGSQQRPSVSSMRQNTKPVSTNAQTIPLFLCGDVMSGRGIGQVLPHANDSQIQEPYVRDARRHVQWRKASQR
jgi:hypothetical protein